MGGGILELGAPTAGKHEPPSRYDRCFLRERARDRGQGLVPRWRPRGDTRAPHTGHAQLHSSAGDRTLFPDRQLVDDREKECGLRRNCATARDLYGVLGCPPVGASEEPDLAPDLLPVRAESTGRIEKGVRACRLWEHPTPVCRRPFTVGL